MNLATTIIYYKSNIEMDSAGGDYPNTSNTKTKFLIQKKKYKTWKRDKTISVLVQHISNSAGIVIYFVCKATSKQKNIYNSLNKCMHIKRPKLYLNFVSSSSTKE